MKQSAFLKSIIVLGFGMSFGLGYLSVFEVNEQMFGTIYSGAITGGIPINFYGYTAHFLLASIYMKCYAWVNWIPWYEIIMCLYIACGSIISIYLLVANKDDRPQSNRWSLLLLGFILCSSYVITMQYTRVAFAIGTASTLLLIANSRGSKWWDITCCLLYGLALLTRPEVGVFILIFQGLGLLLLSSRKVFQWALLVNAVFLLLVIGYIAVDRITTHEFLKQYQPELGYQLLERKNIVPLSKMNNKIDSAKYQATLDMICDPEYINMVFLRSLVANNAYTGYDSSLKNRCLSIFQNSIAECMGIFLIYLGILLIRIRQTLVQTRLTLYKLLTFNLLFWLLIIITIYFIKMTTWAFCSMMVLLCFMLLIGWKVKAPLPRRYLTVLSILLILAGIRVYLKEEISYNRSLKSCVAQNQKFLHQVITKCRGYDIVPGLSQGQMMLNTRLPFRPAIFSTFRNIYLYDDDVQQAEPNYRQYLHKQCECEPTNYTAFMDFLQTNKNRVFIVSDSARINSITRYCRIVRGKDYHIIKIDSFSTCTNTNLYKFE